MEFNVIERQALIIWLYSTKQIKELRKHGYIHYYSRKMKYAIMYVNKKDAEKVERIVNDYYFVREVEYSYRDDIDMTFANAIEHSSDNSLSGPFSVQDEEESLIESIAESLRNKKMNNG
ncbi:MAG: YlbG family protein [Ruoffia tabacinasalis]|uniref:UPF0298 protein FEZ33_03595 n=1 Tax=Ruoffia tabacinasalis TaxID=87458 RepID=A0A5R9EEM9_9LACT|nr:YlbG family protein [Ruoffia tabacinasalis]TLQ48744.1 DUF2129 domain-containing protein [Ruoffia tabacinasalis]